MSEELETSGRKFTPAIPEGFGSVETLPEGREIVDEQGFIRKEFSLDAIGTTVVFAGQEELPTFADRVPSSLITGSHAPRFAGAEEVAQWEGLFTGAIPELTRYIAPATPEGVLMAALQLGVSETSPDVQGLLLQIQSGNFGEEVQDFFDSYYAAITISEEGSGPGAPDETGLFQLLQAYRGDQEQQAKLNAKKTVLAEHDRLDRDPGSPLTPAELQAIKEQNLTLVHTTLTAPATGEDGRLHIQTNGDRTIDQQLAYARSTVHFSMNHTAPDIVTLRKGEFSGRPYTLLVPAEDMMAENGAPRSMAGVDTWFMTEPEHDLVLPKSTVILVTGISDAGPFVERKDQQVVMRTEAYTEASMDELQRFILSEFSDVLGRNGEIHEQDIPKLARQEVAEAISDNQMFKDMINQINQGQAKLDDVQYATEKMKEWFVARRAIAAVFEQHGVSQVTPYDAAEWFIDNPGVLVESAEVQRLVSEGIRTSLAGLYIRKNQGDIVHTDESKRVVAPIDFDGHILTLAKTLGVETGLHDGTPEQYAEMELFKAITAATSGEGQDVSVDWRKIDSRMVWDAITRVPKPARDHILRTGVLSVAKKLPPANKYADVIV